MLVGFSVSNFKSFKEMQSISFVASKITRHKRHVLNVNEKRILKSGLIFGANAGGKSNLVEAIDLSRRIIIDGLDKVDLNKKHFRIVQDAYREPGVFDYRIIVNNTEYSYGIVISYDKKEIIAEWLVRIEKSGKEVYLFNRQVDDNGISNIETEVSGQSEKDETRFNIYLQDFAEGISAILKKKTIKELIAPSGIDASNIDHLEIISNTKRYARSFFVSSLPRMCTFPELFRDMYMFGDINTSIYINPIKEEVSQNRLNREINELETERLVAADRGNINRESIISQKRLEAENLRDQIAAGYNKLYEASIVSTIFAYNMEELERYSKMLTSEMSKTMVGIKSAWGIQEEAFKSNLPLMNDQINRTHTFDRKSMATTFPFTTSAEILIGYFLVFLNLKSIAP